MRFSLESTPVFKQCPQLQQQQTARDKFSSREDHCRWKTSSLLSIIGRRLLSAPLDPRFSMASKLVALSSEQIGTPGSSDTHTFGVAVEVLVASSG